MISIVIPTRNRAHTLALVAPSYFEQDQVDEIIFVNDQGTDNTAEVMQNMAAKYPHVQLKIINNAERQGASQSRNIGVAQARNDYILFCDDDEYMQAGYARICFEKLQEHNAAAISGRRIYMLDGETQADALKRFGNGQRSSKLMRKTIIEYINAATFTGDHKVPITNAIILTRKALLQQYPFDNYYARGNGYREETDYQMNLFVNGHDIYITNDVHTFHLPMSQVRTGGQRASMLKRLYWSIYYTNYFFGKYYARYAARMGIRTPRFVAMALFTLFVLWREVFKIALWGRAMLHRFRRSAA